MEKVYLKCYLNNCIYTYHDKPCENDIVVNENKLENIIKSNMVTLVIFTCGSLKSVDLLEAKGSCHLPHKTNKIFDTQKNITRIYNSYENSIEFFNGFFSGKKYYNFYSLSLSIRNGMSFTKINYIDNSPSDILFGINSDNKIEEGDIIMVVGSQMDTLMNNIFENKFLHLRSIARKCSVFYYCVEKNVVTKRAIK